MDETEVREIAGDQMRLENGEWDEEDEKVEEKDGELIDNQI